MIKSKGFTLIELLITLLIIGGVFGLIMPLARDFLSRNLLDKQSNTIVSAIKFSRNKALFMNRELVLSELSDKNNWRSGMQLFIDNSGHRHFGEGDVMLKQWHWDDKFIHVSWRGVYSPYYLLFSDQVNTSMLNGSFSLTEKNQLKQRIVVNRLGRVRIEKNH